MADLLARDADAFEDEMWKRIDLKRERFNLPRLAAA